MPDTPTILLNGTPTKLLGAPPNTTLLDWLRGSASTGMGGTGMGGLIGTKEGCAEGDCGACTIALEQIEAGRVVTRAANACMLLLGQLDGLSVRTIEGLAAPDGTAHPVQQAYVDEGGTQCGFCTPGFVMATHAHLASGGGTAEADIHDALAGNLCRCTGYRSIVAAVARAATLPAAPLPTTALPTPALASLRRPTDADFGDFLAPRSLSAALALRAAHPDAALLAGGTDLGLLASRARTPPARVIHLAHVPELTTIGTTPTGLRIGAAVPYSDALPALTALHPALRPYLTRIGSVQIRNLGGIGGNLGTASPIGDSHPVLLALDARIELASAARGPRTVPIDAFFTGYRTTALAPDEIITAIELPTPPPGAVLFAEKISKRRDQDISTVAAACLIGLDQGRVTTIRLAYGGVAATPVRARHAEAALLGKPLDASSIAAAIAALPADIAPLSDWRGSAAYRMRLAGNLLRRLHLRLTAPHLSLEVDAL